MEMRTLTTTVGPHHYVFRYAAGQEDHVVDEVMRLADDPRADFGWPEAARMCFEAVNAATAEGPGADSPARRSRL